MVYIHCSHQVTVLHKRGGSVQMLTVFIVLLHQETNTHLKFD